MVPTATPTPTLTPVPKTAPTTIPGGTNLVLNGSFETSKNL